MGIFLRWFCSKHTKTMFVKIVHPGGHVELYDRPISAADIIHRNPKCCVAYPNVFKQPWAIVPPETNLMPGLKFYVVPLSTIRKLQRLAKKKYNPLLFQESIKNSQNNSGREEEAGKIQHNECCKCLGKGMKMKIKGRSEVKTSSNSWGGSSKKKLLPRKRNHEELGGGSSPKRLSFFDQWQPNLESIVEE
ncbi:hypothetical protein M9H77_29229 [Catharanthus roseus]|uniref:Uncharacterized protein n=1 Tax=Catharanthus roseus TaxID=4058 RepID=A0ACC0ALQ9_CATRO|nr:hypothetical protein M9H77_29229 [Catharanthus roseus]